MKYYLIAGERSGDIHGGKLIKEIHKVDPDAVVRCWGGDEMEQAGAELVVHYSAMAFMGFLEVAKNLPSIRRYLNTCKKDLTEFQPDAVILIDYPGFNLRIAQFAKKQGWKVYYYIAPKTWAWNRGRTHKLRKYVDKVFSILPFEEQFFKDYSVNVRFVGNPLQETIQNFKPSLTFREDYSIPDKPIIALLPGSRKQEIQNVLTTLLDVVPHFPQVHFVVAAVGNLPAFFYNPVRSHEQVSIVTDQTYQILHLSQLAIVTSGTATLETALFNVPQIVVYKTSAISYFIARSLIKVPYIALVNLIADKAVVPELIQNDFHPASISKLVTSLLDDSSSRRTQLVEYQKLNNQLGNLQTSNLVANEILSDLSQFK